MQMDRILDNINNVPGNTYQDKLNLLNKCNCCKRHKINKPSVFSLWDESASNYTPQILSTFTDDDVYCSCTCRHVSRMICRQYEPPVNSDINITPPASP